MVYNQSLPQSVPVMQASRSQYALSQSESPNNNYPYLQTNPPNNNYAQNPYQYTGTTQNQLAEVNYNAAPNAVTINRSAVNPYGAS